VCAGTDWPVRFDTPRLSSVYGSKQKRKRSKLLFMRRVVLAAVLALITASGAMSQVVIQVEPPGQNHDQEWYERHGYHWHDGRWVREGEHQ
jgi:hypothetical protein